MCVVGFNVIVNNLSVISQLCLVATGSSILNLGMSRENLSSGFTRKRVSNQPAQLQRLARKLNFGS